MEEAQDLPYQFEKLLLSLSPQMENFRYYPYLVFTGFTYFWSNSTFCRGYILVTNTQATKHRVILDSVLQTSQLCTIKHYQNL